MGVMIVKRKVVKWNKKAIVVISVSILTYYLSLFVLIFLVLSLTSPPIIAFLVLLVFFAFLLFLLMPLEIFKSTEIIENVEVRKVFEVDVDQGIRSFCGANVGEFGVQEKVVITDKGIVRRGYLIEWEKFKSGYDIKSDCIILHAKFGYPSIVPPYKEEIASFIEKKIGPKYNYFKNE